MPSRTLHKHERNYHITELETLAIVWAVKYYRSYLLGHHCLVLMDHAALFSTSNPSAKLARWALIIQEMALDIKYRPGKTNSCTDALSRNLVSCVVAESEGVGLEQRKDSQFKPLISKMVRCQVMMQRRGRWLFNSEAFDLTDGLLYHECANTPVSSGSTGETRGFNSGGT